MNDNERWLAVQARDRDFDGMFVYAVRSTGIYCRPSCPSRRPNRENVQFFGMPAQAEDAGFRPCQRCAPRADAPPEHNLDLVERICRVLDEAHERIPTLGELAERFHLSPYHLQRTFKRIVGVSPRQYADAQRVERLKRHLQTGGSVTDTIYAAGYGSSSSAYEQEPLGMEPIAYRARGAARRIRYTIAPCPLGLLLVAATERGVCAVRLGDSAADLGQQLREEFAAATLDQADDELQPWVDLILRHIRGGQPHLDLPLDIQATAFQRRVWEALRAIPAGSTRSYRQVAEAIGQPTAARAVARACATNPVALVIPCHRVVRNGGDLGGYRWGVERKRQILEGEQHYKEAIYD